MHTIYKNIKRVLLGITLLFLSFYGLIYVLLSINSVQQYAKEKAVHQLSALLKSDLSIERINIRPFNKITLENVLIPDQQQDTLFFAEKVSAGFRWLPLLQKKLSFTTVQLRGFDMRLERTSAHAPLNLQFIIDAFASKDTIKKEFAFDLQLNSVFFHRGAFRYNVGDAPFKSDRFDKNHIAINDISGAVALHTYSADSLNVTLKRLSLSEQSDFKLKKLSFTIAANKKSASLNDFLLRLPESAVRIDSLSFDYSRVAAQSQFADSAFFQLNMPVSQISLADIRAFAPQLRHFEMPVELQMQASGSINQIEAPRIIVSANEEIKLDAGAKLFGISHPSEAYIFGQVNDLTVTPTGIMSLINNFSATNKSQPVIFDRLGTVRFTGDISGFFTNLVAFGKLNTRLGTIHTDVLLGKDFDKNRFTCKGKVSTTNLKSALLLPGNKIPDNITFNLNVNLEKQSQQPITGRLDGTIRKFDFKGYRYENLSLNGDFKGKSFDGSVILDDPNGYARLNGKIDMSTPKQMSINILADIQNLRLGQLKLMPRFANSELALRLNADFTGDSFDTAQGKVALDSLSFINNGEKFFLDKLRINAFNHEDPQVIQINSDLIKAQIRGHYSFAQLVAELRNTVGQALPVVIAHNPTKKMPVNDFEFALQINETSQLQKVLQLPVSWSEKVDLSGFYNSQKGLLRVVGDFPEFQIGKMNFAEGHFLAEMPDDKVRLRFSTLRRNKKNETLALSLNALGENGILTTRLNWSNLAKSTYSGEIVTSFNFEKRPKSKFPLRTEIQFHPSTLIFNDSIWSLLPATTIMDSGRIEVNNFEIKHDRQHLRLDGAFSKHESDSLYLNLQDMSLDYIFQTLNMDFIMFGGQGTGEFLISNQNNTPTIRTDSLKVKDFSYNGELLGNLKLYSDWDARYNGIRMKGDITQPDAKPTLIDGGIYLAQDSLWLNFKANRLNIGFVDIWTNKILSGLQGRASGDITLYGKFKELNLVGEAWGENVSFGIDYLNTQYAITDSIHFYQDGIAFNNIRVYDRNFTQAFANGRINYRNFKDIGYDISFLIPSGRAFQVFNVTEKINPVYWGSIFASGSARIHGTTEKTWIDVSARSSANSKFNFSLNENLTAGDYQFITFHDADAEWKMAADSLLHGKKPILHTPEAVSQGHELFLNLQMEATPDVSITLIMDPVTGDQIKGTGTGNIRLEYNKTNGFKLYGGYTIDKGSYYFNLQDVIMRDFTINQGSRINFRGDPLNAELNINAIYQVTANLTELDESFAQSRELSRPTVPVQCILNIKGDLHRPDLSFDINLPTVSEDIDRQVKSIISTDDMMNRQILYLMILNKFYTPDYVNTNSQQNRYTELSAVASSTLSSQLNNLLGQISDNWNIGTNIRSDKGDFKDVEVELALSSQLLNNRLLFNGNFGYRDNPNANNSFIGDFDLEYLINPSGSWRLKAYNHYNDRNYSVKSALTTQGVGILFKKDFNTFPDLFNLFMRKKHTQQP